MKRAHLLLPVLFLISASLPVAAQYYQPKTIQFKGAPECTDQELLAAADLKNGMALTSAEINQHSKRLVDSGIFEKLDFSFDGQSLIYSLQQSDALYPVRLENLPFITSKDLDATLRARLPLYHGKVPVEGTLLDDVRAALEGMLASQGIHSTLTSTPFIDLKLQKMTAVSFAITTPAVQVGEVHLDSGGAQSDPKVKGILAKLTGSSYSIENTPDLIAANLANYYRDKGYLEVEVRAEPQSTLVITPEVVGIPFHVSIVPGTLYKLSSVQVAPGLLVTQADFDHQSHIHPGDIADGPRVRENWMYIERQYHNKGYLKASAHATPSFNRAEGTVGFSVTVEPGPIYKMGALTIQNVSDDLRAAMLAAWKMPAGSVFNEGAIRGFFATHNVNPALERVFAMVDFKYDLAPHDDTQTVDLTLRLERKH
jgi:outer membrane protein insertion porin family